LLARCSCTACAIAATTLARILGISSLTTRSRPRPFGRTHIALLLLLLLLGTPPRLPAAALRSAVFVGLAAGGVITIIILIIAASTSTGSSVIVIVILVDVGELLVGRSFVEQSEAHHGICLLDILQLHQCTQAQLGVRTRETDDCLERTRCDGQRARGDVVAAA